MHPACASSSDLTWAHPVQLYAPSWQNGRAGRRVDKDGIRRVCLSVFTGMIVENHIFILQTPLCAGLLSALGEGGDADATGATTHGVHATRALLCRHWP